LTTLEVTTIQHKDQHEQYHETHSKHRDRLDWHERAIIGILGLLYILMQDKFPAVAKIIRQLIM
jgi:hypothetical protein